MTNKEVETMVKNQKMMIDVIEQGIEKVKQEREEWENMLSCWCLKCGEYVQCIHPKSLPHEESMCGNCAGDEPMDWSKVDVDPTAEYN